MIAGGLVFLLFACANPVPPTGGPRDQTPPSITSTRPSQDTVNVSTSTRTVSIQFSEYVERSALPRALTITPRIDGRIRFDWSGRSVSIELPGRLRDSTTYLFTLGTDLTDSHGVSLENPIRFAFSTGPRINRGQFRGEVVGPDEGKPRPKVNVFAYAVADTATAPPTPFPDGPAYQTQTGEEGAFSFEYLREDRYFVLALRDNNRNRTPDPAEPFAVPPRVSFQVDSSEQSIPVPWVLTQVDTLAPSVQGAQAVSRRRVRIRFSEAVRIVAGADAWTLRDSITGAAVPVRSVYQSARGDAEVVLRTTPMNQNPHRLLLLPNLVTDTVGHKLRRDTVRFSGVSRADTMQTRFQGFAPADLSRDSTGASPLLPGVRPGVQFNQAPDSAKLRRVLVLQDTTGEKRSYQVSTSDGRTYQLQPDSVLRPGDVVEVVVNGGPLGDPDTTYTRRFRRVTSRMLGELEGRVVVVDAGRSGGPRPSDTSASALPPGADSASAERRLGQPRSTGDTVTLRRRNRDGVVSSDSVVVELIPTKSSIPLEPRTVTLPPGSTFVFRELPEGTFRFRGFVDRNGDGRWTGGTIQPYTPAEPLGRSDETVDSRPRWTNVLPSPLRVPVLPASEAPPEKTTVPDTTSADSVQRR